MIRIKHAAFWAIPMMLTAGYAGQARSDEHMVLVDTIDVGGPLGLGAFDISFVDPTIGLYVLADRTNASIDFFDASDNTFIGRVGGFKGVILDPVTKAAVNSKSGPDGVVIIDHKEVWAGDGDSTLKVIDIATFAVTDIITIVDPNDGTVKLRVDEMAYDSADHILAAANNANTPPFVTMVNTDTHEILGQIVFDGKNGTPNAIDTGIEQPQWSPKTGLFYVAVPQIGPKDPTLGGISVIDPSTMTVIANYPVSNCSPGGLTLGPRHEAMIGCNSAFVIPPNTVATTQSIVMNLDNGDIVANITQAGGNDQVWYDKGTHHYYLSARNTLTAGKVTPIMATVDAKTNTFDGDVASEPENLSVARWKRSAKCCFGV